MSSPERQSEASEFDPLSPLLTDEFAATMRRLISGSGPETVTHLLMEEKEPLTREGIAALLGKRTFGIDMTLVALEVGGWLIRFPEHGLEKYILTTPKPHTDNIRPL